MIKRPDVIIFSTGHPRREFPHIEVHIDGAIYDVWMSVDIVVIAPDVCFNMTFTEDGNGLFDIDDKSKEQIKMCRDVWLLLHLKGYV